MVSGLLFGAVLRDAAAGQDGCGKVTGLRRGRQNGGVCRIGRPVLVLPAAIVG